MRDNLMAQLLELGKSKPRGKESEVLLADITRLESTLSVARDDLVCVWIRLVSTLTYVTNTSRKRARRGCQESRMNSSISTERFVNCSLIYGRSAKQVTYPSCIY